MSRNTRREFMGDVGRGMLLAGLGTSLAYELGLAKVHANDADSALNFGKLEPLVALMQDTPPEKLTAQLVEQLKSGTSLQTLVTAGALANARTFGGQDYVGFHTFMALAPAYRMSQQLPSEQQPLPVLKVLFRNANRIQEFGGRKAGDSACGQSRGSADRRWWRVPAPGRTWWGHRKSGSHLCCSDKAPIGEAFNHLQWEVQDEVDVHRVVLSWRAWDTLEIAGQEWAQCLLRQSIRYCANTECRMAERKYAPSAVRKVLPALLDQYKLVGATLGDKTGDDQWLSDLAKTIFGCDREQAADAVAQALRDGFSPEAIGEAISLAANRLVLHDPGRTEQQSNADKPAGSCHGDSVGVHASDAANAWRNIVRVSNPRNVVASLIVGAFHTGGQSQRSNKEPYPFAEHFAEIKTDNPKELLGETETAIRAKDQFRAAALVARYGQLGHDSQPVFNVLLKFATSEDGALHAEKYFNTAMAEYAATRPAFRWGQLVALARVSASEFGHRSAGYEEAKKLLKV